MPIYEVDGLDGKTYEVEGPPGASNEQIIASVLARFPYAGKTTEALKAEPAAPFSAKDTGIAGLQGLVGGVSSFVGGFGADTTPAQYLRGLNKDITSAYSPERKAEMARRQELTERAEGKGALTEIGTGAAAVGEAPLQSVAQGLGSTVLPALGGILLAGAGGIAVSAGVPIALAAAGLTLMGRLAMGVVMGAGEAKGNIYDTVKEQLKAQHGATEEQAEKVAAASQEYLGDNWKPILTNGFFGMLDAGTGAERIVSNAFKPDDILKKQALKSTGVKAPTWAGTLTKTPLVEAVPEGLQGGAGQWAENVALSNVGIQTDPMKGVLSAATQEALVGALTGAAVSPMQHKAEQALFENDQRLKRKEQSDKLEAEIQKRREEYEAQLAKTAEQFAPPKTLALPAPPKELPDAPPPSDPLRNPTGFVTKDELAPEVFSYVDKFRKDNGLPPLKHYSIEDIVDAMPGLDPRGEQGALDSLIAAKTGFSPETKVTAQDVLNAAIEKNVDTKTRGFNDFLARTTGGSELSALSKPQLYAAFKAIKALPTPDAEGKKGGVTVLPEGTNATRFSQKQYDRALKGVDLLLSGGEPLDVGQILTEIKEYSGLETDDAARALLDAAIRNGDLDSIKTPRFRTFDAAGRQVGTYSEKAKADAAAKRNGLTVKDFNAEAIGPPSTAAVLPQGFDIREGAFKEGEQAASFDLMAGDQLLHSAPTAEEAQGKLASYQKNRGNLARTKQNQLDQKNAQVERSQEALNKMEATGQGQSVAYQRASAKHAALVQDTQAQVATLTDEIAKLDPFQTPLKVVPRGIKPVSRKGYTVYQNGLAKAKFPDRTAAEESILTDMSDDALQALSRDQSRRGLGKRAQVEIQRRKTAPDPKNRKVSEVLKDIDAKLKEEADLRAGLTGEVKAKIDKIEKFLRPLLDKIGLGDVAVKVVNGLADEGSYGSQLIKIALDVDKPVRTMRHEAIHALKAMGFFTPQQWAALERQARSVWIDKYLKGRPGPDGGTRLDAYMKLYNGNMEPIIEEAIADAFADFDSTGAPAGMLAAILKRLNAFFAALRNAVNGAGFRSAEGVFRMIEGGKLKATKTDKGTGTKPSFFGKSETQRAQPGANMKRLAGLLGPQLYGDMRKVGTVTVKELFQNSFDALKGLIEKREMKNDAVISIDVDTGARTITVTDNGNGMTPKIINSAFLTIAGTNKETDRSSGGFGIAKMLFLFGNERLELTTVRDGVESKMVATGAQLMESFENPAAAPDIVTRKTDDPSGTTIMVKIPENWKNPSSGEEESIRMPDEYEVRYMIDKSPLFEPITVEVNGRTIDIGTQFPQQDFTTFATVKFDWGTARIVIGKKEEDFGNYSHNLTVLSNGLFQFDSRLSTNPMDPESPAVPRNIYVNVEPRVKPEDPGYPFALNRQDFSPAVKNDFQKIYRYLSVLYSGSKTAESAAGFGKIEYVDAKGIPSEPMNLAPKIDKDVRKGMLHINEGDVISITDGRMTVNGREVPELKPEDLSKAFVDAAKFKIEQSEIDPAKPMIHDNIDVQVNPARRAWERLAKEMQELMDQRDDAVDKYYDSMKVPGSTDAEHNAAFKEVERLNKLVEEISERAERADEEAQASTDLVSTPITQYMRDLHGRRFDKYLHDIGSVFIKLRDAVIETNPDYAEMKNIGVGVSFDKKYLGVSVMVPFRGMFINPAISDFDRRQNPTAKRRASDMIYTMVHEIAHYLERSHGPSFADEMQRIIVELDTSDTMSLSYLREELTLILEKYKDVYADLNYTFRTETITNRGVKFNDDGYRGVSGGTGADARAGQAGRAEGLGREAEEGAGPSARGEDEGRVRGPAGQARHLNDKPSLRAGIVAEVAPNPDQAVSEEWRKMSPQERYDTTRAVAKNAIDGVLSLLDRKGFTYTISSGRYENEVNPNIILKAPDDASLGDLNEVARLAGYVLDQKAMVTWDEENASSDNQAGFVKVALSPGMTIEDINRLRKHINDAVPQADGDTLRDGTLVFGNFSEYNENVDTIADEQYYQDISAAIKSFDFDGHLDVTGPFKFHSELIQPDAREGYLEGTRYGESDNEKASPGRNGVRGDGRKRLEYLSEQAQGLRSRWIAGSRADARRRSGEGAAGAGRGRPEVEYGTARPDAVAANGWHFSKQHRPVLSSHAYGSGMRGAESNRLAEPGNKDIRNRLYFYVDQGAGVRPEDGVGGEAHGVRLQNLYDTDADPLGIVKNVRGPSPEDRANSIERSVMQAGFDGYVAKGPQQGVAVLVGDHQIPMDKPSLRQEVVEAAGPAIRYLTPQERTKLRIDTATKLRDLFANMPSANEMAAIAHAGRAKRGWYYNSAQALIHVFGPDAPRFAALLAAMSPQTGVQENLLNALRTWKNWIDADRPTKRGQIFEIMGASVLGNKLTDSVLPAWVNNSVRALSSIDPGTVVISGPKVNSFMLNLRGVTEEVTNDAWMATYADVEQKIFAGRINKAETEPGKSPGYLAMSARVRQAAMRLSQLTGERWSPAEVQETVWSWTKTLYEMQTKYVGARELLDNGAITDQLIAATPDFRTLLHEDRNDETLRQAGYGRRLDTLRTRRNYESTRGKETGTRRQTAPFDPDTQERLEQRAANRLERVKDERGQVVEKFSLRTIEVDGQRRPIEDANGRLVGRDFKEQSNFWRWFGDSKAVQAVNAETGDAVTSSREPSLSIPQVMYHTTRSDVSVFEAGRTTKNSGTFGDWETTRAAFFVTPELEASQAYGKEDGKYANSANVMPLYVRAKNPLDLTGGYTPQSVLDKFASVGINPRWLYQFDWSKFDDEDGKNFVDAAKRLGYDAIIFNDENPDTGRNFESWALFDPEQIKSAIGNNGAYDPANVDIRKSLRSTTNPAIVAAVDRVTTARDEKTHAQRMADLFKPDSRSAFRAHALNRYNRAAEYDRKLADQMGGTALLADVSAEAAMLMSDLSAGVVASALGVHDHQGGIPVYRNGHTSVTNLNGTVKGPVAIFAPLAKMGDPFIYQLYQFAIGAKRGTRLIAEGKERLYTPAEIQYANSLMTQYPQFQQIHNDWIKYNNGLMQFLVDTGVLDPARKDEFIKYSDYLPFYRQLNGEDTIGPRIFQSPSGVKGPKKITGGDAPLGDFLETIVRNTQASIAEGMKNVAGQRAVKVAEQIQMAMRQRKQSSGLDMVTVMEHGKPVSYQVADPLFIESMKSLNLPELPFMGLLSGPSTLLRNLVTRDPGFMLANMMRDSLSAYVTSGINLTPVASTVMNFGKALAGNDPAFAALMNAGVLGGYEFSRNVEQSAQSLEKAMKKAAGVRGSLSDRLASPFVSLWDALERGTTASDAATRMEIYKKTMDRTGNEAEAIYRALEVMNFNRKGSSPVVRIATAAIPFLNARMQGLDVLYRTAFGKMGMENAAQMQKTFFVRGMTMAALSCMYWALVHGDPDYEKQEEETKDNYWIVGKAKVPIPFEVGVLFKVIPERIMALAFGDDTGKDFLKSMGRQLSNTLMVNPMPQAAMPVFEAAVNHSFFTGRDIVPESMTNVASEFQIGPGTSKVAQEIGEAAGLSPLKVDHIIRGYTGTIGMYMTDLIDSIINSQSANQSASKRLEQLPILRRFMVDPHARGTVTAYYDLKNAVDQAVRTFNLLERTQNYEELRKYAPEHAKLLAARDYIAKMEKDMKWLRDAKTQVRASKMSADEKEKVLTRLGDAENDYTANIKSVRAILTSKE